MRILIGAFGTRGDVQPMLALARVLKGRGHEVTLCVPPNFVEWARKLGFEARGAGVDFEKFIADHGENMLRAISAVREEFVLQLEAMVPLAETADLYLSSGMCPAARVLSERYGKPGRFILFTPSLIPSDDYPSPLTPWQGMPPWLNRASWRIEAKMMNLAFKKTLNHVRIALELPALKDVWSYLIGEHCLVASEALLAAPPAALTAPIQQTGAWFFEDPLEVPREVEEFLATGPAPVFIGFGSMTDSRPERTMKRLLEAIRLAGVRAIIARGWAGLNADSLPENVLMVGPTPHAKIFPRCAAVVHHAGAGTLHQTLRAGVPHIPMPHLIDQFFWSERLERAKLTPGRLPRGRIDPKRLAEAFRRCIDDHVLRARCREFASRMTLDGVERTVGLLEKIGHE